MWPIVVLINRQLTERRWNHNELLKTHKTKLLRYFKLNEKPVTNYTWIRQPRNKKPTRITQSIPNNEHRLQYSFNEPRHSQIDNPDDLEKLTSAKDYRAPESDVWKSPAEFRTNNNR